MTRSRRSLRPSISLEDEGLAEREEAYGQYKELVPMFREMEKLAAILREKRELLNLLGVDFLPGGLLPCPSHRFHVVAEIVDERGQLLDALPALSCLMTVEPDGEISDYEICESVIRVDKRMSYTVVKELLEDEGLAEREEAYGQAGG